MSEEILMTELNILDAAINRSKSEWSNDFCEPGIVRFKKKKFVVLILL